MKHQKVPEILLLYVQWRCHFDNIVTNWLQGKKNTACCVFALGQVKNFETVDLYSDKLNIWNKENFPTLYFSKLP